jgi:uncharacterized protein (DUF1015 family)
LFNSSNDTAIKENARINLELLRADEDIEQLDKLAQQFSAKTGRPPRNIGELIQSGLIAGVPADPEGHGYVIGPDGKAKISEKSPLFKEKNVYRRPL